MRTGQLSSVLVSARKRRKPGVEGRDSRVDLQSSTPIQFTRFLTLTELIHLISQHDMTWCASRFN